MLVITSHFPMRIMILHHDSNHLVAPFLGAPVLPLKVPRTAWPPTPNRPTARRVKRPPALAAAAPDPAVASAPEVPETHWSYDWTGGWSNGLLQLLTTG